MEKLRLPLKLPPLDLKKIFLITIYLIRCFVFSLRDTFLTKVSQKRRIWYLLSWISHLTCTLEIVFIDGTEINSQKIEISNPSRIHRDQRLKSFLNHDTCSYMMYSTLKKLQKHLFCITRPVHETIFIQIRFAKQQIGKNFDFIFAF